jgi:hypothetical protein
MGPATCEWSASLLISAPMALDHCRISPLCVNDPPGHVLVFIEEEHTQVSGAVKEGPGTTKAVVVVAKAILPGDCCQWHMLRGSVCDWGALLSFRQRLPSPCRKECAETDPPGFKEFAVASQVYGCVRR